MERIVGLGNGDLILLLAFKNNWKLKIRDCVDNLKLRHAHAWRILETFKAKGICRKEIIKKTGNGNIKGGRRINVYIFNDKAVSIVGYIFNKKILPKIPLTPEDFLKADELYLIVEKE